jgi:phosphate transport system substrate-binding protein
LPLVSRFLAIAILVGTACGGAPAPTTDPIAGLYRIGGGDALLNIARALADAFAAKHPGVKFTYDTSLGSEGAITLAAQQEIDLGMAGRELTAAESERVDRVFVGIAGAGLVVHQSNPLKDLTTAQIISIYSGQVSDWMALGHPKSLPMIPLVRERGSSARAAFENYVFGGKPTYGGGVLEIQGGDQIRQAVAGQPGALGIVGITGNEVAPAGTHILSIDGIFPTKASVRDGSYKMLRPLYLVYARKSPQRPGVSQFVDFIRSADGQKIIDRF